MLRVEGLEVGYGPLTVLRDITLRVEAGTIVALIGANGAGKTTLLKAISGLLRPGRGTIRFGDVDITGMAPHRIVRLGISQVPEGRQIFAGLTVRDNLELGGFSRARRGTVDSADIDRLYQLFPILAARSGQAAGTLSGGEQQMLAMARALMARPKLLLLDEPSLGLAPMVVKMIFETIAGLKQAHLAIMLVEQNARAALAMADWACVLETGRIVAQGAGARLLQEETIQRSYLGQGLVPRPAKGPEPPS